MLKTRLGDFLPQLNKLRSHRLFGPNHYFFIIGGRSSLVERDDRQRREGSRPVAVGRLTRTFFFPMITIMLYEGAIVPPVRVRPAAAFHFIAEGAAPEKQKKNEEYYRREKGARETRELERQGRSETGARPHEENHKFWDGSRWRTGTRVSVFSDDG